MEAYTCRLAELQHHQRCLNMEPRGDSALTEMYARGEVAMTASEVARELMATDYIYKHTLYGEVIEDFMREVADNLRRMHALSWTATWTIVRAYAPMALKLMMLRSCGARIPERLPDPPPQQEDVGAVATTVPNTDAAPRCPTDSPST